jgi:hypothetical protein
MSIARGGTLLLSGLLLVAVPATDAGGGTTAGLPPVSATSLLADSLTWPAPHAYRHKRSIETLSDSITVTTSMVVADGKYLLWIRRPRVVVAVVRPLDLPAGSWPDAVLVEFKAKSPQYTATNILTLSTSGVETLSAPATSSRVMQRTFVDEHTLTFSLPLADFLRAVQGDALRLEVGGVEVRLGREQLDALRDFAVRVHDAGSGGAPPS